MSWIDSRIVRCIVLSWICVHAKYQAPEWQFLGERLGEEIVRGLHWIPRNEELPALCRFQTLADIGIWNWSHLLIAVQMYSPLSLESTPAISSMTKPKSETVLILDELGRGWPLNFHSTRSWASSLGVTRPSKCTDIPSFSPAISCHRLR